MKGFCILLAAIGVFSYSGYSQTIYWADSIVSYSSQKSEKAFSAEQVIGKPSKFPNPGHTTCAWSPEYSDLRSGEFIEVSFPVAIVAKQIVVVENSNSGHIKSIFVYDEKHTERQVYTRSDDYSVGGGRLFVLTLRDNINTVNGVKLLLDKPESLNTYQIDAIGITDALSEIKIELNEIVDSLNYKAESLGINVNSDFDEVYPIIAPDGKTLYFDRKLHPENLGDKKNDDIWTSIKVGDQWTKATNIGPPLNNSNHNFLCSISPDGNVALVGSDYTNPLAEDPGVSLTYKTDVGWSDPIGIKVNGFKNLNQYNEFSLAPDGTTLIMSSETLDGFGLLDLYVSFLQENGSFSNPINLGNNINTAGNEMTPFLAADGKTLFFSSTGFPGYGFQDIYMSRRLDNTWVNWTEPINLGKNVNSPEWEAYYTIDAHGEYAYFSTSNTAGSNLDIFRIKLPPTVKPENILWLKGIVSDRITGAKVAARIEYKCVTDSLVRGNSNTTTTDGYAIILPQSASYNIMISADNYYTGDTSLVINALESYSEIVQNFTLIPKQKGAIIEMRNILFGINSSVLEDTSFTELDKVVKFLDQNPGVEIEIRGHTNSLCDDNYCITLSSKRAKSVMDYFISKGINANRLTYKGLGKSVPIADNKTAAGRQINQRVEFMITKTE